MGVLRAKGADVLDLIDRLSTNDISKLEDNAWMDTVFTTNKGRIVAQVRLLKSSKQILILSDNIVKFNKHFPNYVGDKWKTVFGAK